jgi:uncharacterized protein (DUF111 family)
MKLLYLACFAGISGDMFLGALLAVRCSRLTRWKLSARFTA